jgi:Uma2 family endonuclease
MSARTRVEVPRRRFTVGGYERMGAAGVLGEDDRVELLDGEIVEMSPIGPLHAALVDRLTRLFVRLAGPDVVVRVQNPVRIGSYSEPEPDLVLAHRRDDGFLLAHPVPDDVALLVEVADSSLPVDRGVKVPLYARAGIVEVWIVDPAERRVLVHRDPSGDGYQDTSVARPGDTVTATALPDVVLDVGQLLTGV